MYRLHYYHQPSTIPLQTTSRRSPNLTRPRLTAAVADGIAPMSPGAAGAVATVGRCRLLTRGDRAPAPINTVL